MHVLHILGMMNDFHFGFKSRLNDSDYWILAVWDCKAAGYGNTGPMFCIFRHWFTT